MGDITVDSHGVVQQMNCSSEESFGPVLQAGVRELGPLTAQVKFQDLPPFVESGFEPVGISEDKTIMTLRSGDPADRDGLQASVFAGGMTLVANVVDESGSDDEDDDEESAGLRAGAGCGCAGGRDDEAVTTVEALLVDNNTNQTLDVFDIHVAPHVSRPGALSATVESVGALQGGGGESQYDRDTAHAMIRRLLAQSGVTKVNFGDDEDDDEDGEDAEPDAVIQGGRNGDPQTDGPVAVIYGGQDDDTPETSDFYRRVNATLRTAFDALKASTISGNETDYANEVKSVEDARDTIIKEIDSLEARISLTNDSKKKQKLEKNVSTLKRLVIRVQAGLEKAVVLMDKRRSGRAPAPRLGEVSASGEYLTIRVPVPNGGDRVLQQEVRRCVDTAIQRYQRRNSVGRRQYVGYKRNSRARKPGNNMWYVSNIQRSFAYKDPNDPTGKKQLQISKAYTLKDSEIERLQIPASSRTPMFLSAVADFMADVLLHNQVVQKLNVGTEKPDTIDLESPYFQVAKRLRHMQLFGQDDPRYLKSYKIVVPVTIDGKTFSVPVSGLRLRPIEEAYLRVNSGKSPEQVFRDLRGEQLAEKIALRERFQGPRQRRKAPRTQAPRAQKAPKTVRRRKPRAPAAVDDDDEVARAVAEFNQNEQTPQVAAADDDDADFDAAGDAGGWGDSDDFSGPAPATAPAAARFVLEGLSKRQLADAVPSSVPELYGTPDRAAPEVRAPPGVSNRPSDDDLMDLINAAPEPEVPKRPKSKKERSVPKTEGVKTRRSGIQTRSRSKKGGLRGGSVDDTMSVMSYDDAMMSVLLE